MIRQESEFKVWIKIEICSVSPRGPGQTKPGPTVESPSRQEPTQSNIRVHRETTNQSHGYGAKPFSGFLGLINSRLTKYVARQVFIILNPKENLSAEMI